MHVVTLLRKPLSKNETVASNSLATGCGGINVDGCRIETSEMSKRVHKPGVVYDGCHEGYERPGRSKYTHKTDWEMEVGGRWPANLILTPATTQTMDDMSGFLKTSGAAKTGRPATATYTNVGSTQIMAGKVGNGTLHADEGGASRFFKQVIVCTS